MRKAFEPQQRLDCRSVLDVQLNLNCRDEIIPILRALQYIYSQPKLRDDILQAIAEDVNGASDPKRGRKGLYYWEILVLAGVRLGCELDYDALQDLAENHRALRHIMGIGDWDEDTSFDWRRIQDNLTKIRTETLKKINHLIVAAGQELVPEAAESVRADSFVAETNIHYPTESTLIRDGLRKLLALGTNLATRIGAGGWKSVVPPGTWYWPVRMRISGRSCSSRPTSGPKETIRIVLSRTMTVRKSGGRAVTFMFKRALIRRVRRGR